MATSTCTAIIVLVFPTQIWIVQNYARLLPRGDNLRARDRGSLSPAHTLPCRRNLNTHGRGGSPKAPTHNKLRRSNNIIWRHRVGLRKGLWREILAWGKWARAGTVAKDIGRLRCRGWDAHDASHRLTKPQRTPPCTQDDCLHSCSHESATSPNPVASCAAACGPTCSRTGRTANHNDEEDASMIVLRNALAQW